VTVGPTPGSVVSPSAHRPDEAGGGAGGPVRRLMGARDSTEAHRGVTPLELLVDLCFVVAVAQAAASLRTAGLDGRIVAGLPGFLVLFFLIWWGWVSFAWFASAYDTDDVPFRLLTLVHIAGVLVLASGIPGAVVDHDLVTVAVGYVIMRMVMVAHWVRAALEHRDGRAAAGRYAVGITASQLALLPVLLLGSPWFWTGWGVLVAAELAIPVWAESRGTRTSWHPGHITERYGLFTLIVLGQCVAAATLALHAAVTDQGVSGSLLLLAGGALLLVFGLWWSYFDFQDTVTPALGHSQRSALIWAYSHYGVYAATAALGAGLEVAATTLKHGSTVSTATAAFLVAVPVAGYLLIVGRLHTHLSPDGAHRPGLAGVAATAVLLSAASVAVVPLAVAVAAMGLCVAGPIGAALLTAHHQARPVQPPARGES